MDEWSVMVRMQMDEILPSKGSPEWEGKIRFGLSIIRTAQCRLLQTTGERIRRFIISIVSKTMVGGTFPWIRKDDLESGNSMYITVAISVN